jgi:hypothetical protein
MVDGNFALQDLHSLRHDVGTRLGEILHFSLVDG